MVREYNISKTTGRCRGCGKELQAGQEHVAVVREADEELVREDYCLPCRPSGPPADDPTILGEWRARVPTRQEKKRLFVDDQVLVSFFHRLEGAEEPARLGFRFVLALVLTRKKLLVYERTDRLPDGRDAWTVRLRGTDQTCQVIDPHLDERQIAEVSERLGEVLQSPGGGDSSPADLLQGEP